MSQEIKATIQALTAEIKSHAHAYYVEDKPVISDSEYDQLLRKLQTLEEQFPQYKDTNSPTDKIIGKVKQGFKQVTHRVPMLSLGNAMDATEAAQFAIKSGDTEYCAEPKYDGLSCSVIYSDGVLVQGATRGDGEVGEDVSAQVKTIKNLPKILKKPVKGLVEIRGEVLMKLADFEALNEKCKEEGIPAYVNPRNAAAGALRNLDPEVTKERNLSFFAYSMVQTDAENIGLSTQSQVVEFLISQGFEVSSEAKLVKGIEGINNYFEEMSQKRNQLDYEIDGLVFKVNSFEEQENLGWTTKVPKWAIAYKFPAQEVSTVLEAIDIQVGRRGTLTPVGRLKPVFVGGVTVSNVTLHNLEEVQRLQLNVGDTIFIKRAGDVIPKVVANATPKGPSLFAMPKTCPVCSSPVVQESGKVAFRCTGSFSCSAQSVGMLSHFVSRSGLDIEGLGETIVEKFYKKGLVSKPTDFFKLTESQILSVDGFAKASAKKLYNAIQAKKGVPLNKFLYSLGIEHMGESTSKDIAQKVKSVEGFLRASAEDFSAMEGVGPVSVSSITEFIAKYHGEIKELAAFVQPLEIKEETAVSTESKIFGKTFVITGTLSQSRDHFASLIESNGGKVSGSVSKKTDYLLCGENAGSKEDKAIELKVPILKEEDFLKMIA